MSSLRLFSRRFEQLIYDKDFDLSLGRRLRSRLWSLLERSDHHYSYHPYPNDNWTEPTSCLEQLPSELLFRYGEDELMAYPEDGDGLREPTNLEGLVKRGYPGQVLDVLELFNHQLPEDKRSEFCQHLNTILEEEDSRWRMLDGRFIKVDSEFLDYELALRTHQLLEDSGYEGAMEELNDARNDLEAGDIKGAIRNACNSLESVLKTLLEQDKGSASHLIRKLYEVGFHNEIPDSVARSFGEQVLMSLPFMRNRLGGHGQGAEVVNVPKEYGQLAVHLSAAFSFFIVNRGLKLDPRESDVEEDDSSFEPWTEDEVPF